RNNLEVLQPCSAGPRVGQPQVLYIKDGKLERLENRSDIAQTRDVPPGENMAGNPGIRRSRVASTDRVDQAETLRFQAALDDGAQRAEVGEADVLQHAD